MKKLLIICLLPVCFELKAQQIVPDTLLDKECFIILSNKVIPEVVIKKQDAYKIEYYDGKAVKDILKEDLLRLDFKDYSLLFENGNLKKIKYYDVLVTANTYSGIITDKKNGQIYFSKKNNNTIRAYPPYTKYIEGTTIYPIEVTNKPEPASTADSAKTSPDSVISSNDSLINEPVNTAPIANTNPLASVTPVKSDEIDPITSYELGQQYAERTFDKIGYTTLSCLGYYCFAGPYILINLKTKEIPYRDYPKGVNKKMFEEGYKNKIHQKRRKALAIGAAIGYGIILTYMGIVLYVLFI